MQPNTLAHLNEIDIIQPQALQAFIHAAQRALTAKIKHFFRVRLVATPASEPLSVGENNSEKRNSTTRVLPADFGRDVVGGARNPLEGLAQHELTAPVAIPGRSVDEIHACNRWSEQAATVVPHKQNKRA
jgi:hypothetical protein